MLPITRKISDYNHSAPNNIMYIVIHDTGNYNDTAAGNANYFCGGDRQASAHYFVDPTSIYQVVEEYDGAWHCGDGGMAYGIGNHNSIGIEMCKNAGDIAESTVSNTIELVKYLMNKYNLSLDRVVRHYDASRKNCPASFSYNNWARWNDFKSKLTVVQSVKPAGLENVPTIKYQAQVQNVGWQGWKQNGEVAGTEGQGLRLEALAIQYRGQGDIIAEGHIQNKGWQSIRHDGEVVGTVEEALRLEAIKISLEDKTYSVMYQVHVENIGWMDWVKDGEIAGTTGEGKRIEAIKIKIAKR